MSDKSGRFGLLLLAAAVVAALVALVALSRGEREVAERRSVAADNASAAEAPAVPPPRRPESPPAVARDEAAASTDESDDTAAEDETPVRQLDEQGRLVADHRGSGPAEGITPSLISRRAGAALRVQLRPEVDACADALSDRDMFSGTSFSVTLQVSARAGQYELRSPKAVSRDLAEQPFFACIEERLEGLTIAAPNDQPDAESQRVTFPFRVP